MKKPIIKENPEVSQHITEEVIVAANPTTSQHITEGVIVAAKSYPEMVEDLLKTANHILDEIVPITCLVGYCFGNLTKKEIKAIEKKNPKIFDSIRDDLKKAIELTSIKECKKCKNKTNIKDKFCSNCGEKITK